MHDASECFTLTSLNCKSDVYHLNLFLDTVHNSGNCLGIVVEIIHGQVEPRDMEYFVSEFLSNLKTELLHKVERKIDCFQLWHIEESKNFLIEIVSDAIVGKVQTSNAW